MINLILSNHLKSRTTTECILNVCPRYKWFEGVKLLQTSIITICTHYLIRFNWFESVELLRTSIVTVLKVCTHYLLLISSGSKMSNYLELAQ